MSKDADFALNQSLNRTPVIALLQSPYVWLRLTGGGVDATLHADGSLGPRDLPANQWKHLEYTGGKRLAKWNMLQWSSFRKGVVWCCLFLSLLFWRLLCQVFFYLTCILRGFFLKVWSHQKFKWHPAVPPGWYPPMVPAGKWHAQCHGCYPWLAKAQVVSHGPTGLVVSPRFMAYITSFLELQYASIILPNQHINRKTSIISHLVS